MLNGALVAVSRWWTTHSWHFGPPTELITCTATVYAHVDWSHLGVTVDLVSDAGGRRAGVWVGPFGLVMCAGPSRRQLRREQAGQIDPDPRIATGRVGDRALHAWVSHHEFGLAVRGARMPSGFHGRALVGPFGFAVEPAMDPPP